MTGKSKFGPVDICLDLGTNVMYTFFPIERLLIPRFGYCGCTVFTVRAVRTAGTVRAAGLSRSPETEETPETEEHPEMKGATGHVFMH